MREGEKSFFQDDPTLVGARDAALITILRGAFFTKGGYRLRKIVVKYFGEAGVKQIMSPHRIRHSAIMAVVLDATDGNVRKTQKTQPTCQT